MMYSQEGSTLRIRPVPPLFNTVYNYKYNGKEFQDELGLNMYDYGARNYDASIGRFSTYDPLAEKTSEPYSYCYNNPVNVIDPTGMSGEDWIKRGSTIFYDASVTTQSEAQGKYGAEAQIMSEGSTTTGTVNGEVSYQYTYHNDGTITDISGNQVDAGRGFTTPGGTTVVGTESIFGNLWKDFFSSTSSNPVEQYRANRDNPGYNAGEGKFDRIFRLMNSSHAENMLDFGGGGHNMFGGYGRSTRALSVYRVYGGDSPAAGFSWTTENPLLLGNYRNAAGLPSGGASGSINTGQFVIEGSTNASKVIKSRGALPLDGNAGGMPELIINPKHVTIKRVSGANPNF